MAEYCSDPFLYNDTMTNSTSSLKKVPQVLNDSAIYSGNNLEPLSLVMNGSSRYININFMRKNNQRNMLLIVGYQRATIP
jgi:hypothetical protein